MFKFNAPDKKRDRSNCTLKEVAEASVKNKQQSW